MNTPMVKFPREPFYPESDREPMAETDVHRQEMAALIAVLERRYREDVNVYVSGNNFLYYVEGDPKKSVSPDVYLVRGVPKRARRTFKLWEERAAPCFVMEMSSRKTWLEDVGNKKALYAMLGVLEYYLYDPEADAVKPPLQGYRLQAGGEYLRIAAREDGSVESESLDLVFSLDGRIRLQVRDANTGEMLLRPEDALDVEHHARVAAEQRAGAAEQRAGAAEQRALAAERELEKLRGSDG